MRSETRLRLVTALCFCVLVLALRPLHAQDQAQQENMFQNPSFESGTAPFGISKAASTVATFKVDDGDAIVGKQSALVTIESSTGDVQFGQRIAAGQKDKTYTFAVLAKSADEPVFVRLEVERAGDPWDRATRSRYVTIGRDQWTELHVTFKVADDFPEGWFAYITCSQPNVRFRADMFRLYEGEYVPCKEAEEQEKAPAAAPVAAAPAAPVATSTDAAARPENLFGNPSFETGPTPWGMSIASGTVVTFKVDDGDAAAGEQSALVTMEAATGYGVQFGQRVRAGQKDKTYTFAVLAKGVGDPVALRPEIERAGDPWDRATVGQYVMVTEDEWTELHATFNVVDDFPEGWFAYIACAQPNVRFRADMFRLYEGEYVAHGEAARPSAQPKNAFVNPSFEMGPAIWNLGKEAATEASLEVNAEDAADGERSALLTLGSVSGWGVQFGQRVAAGQQGKTYTFAALGKSVGGPVAVGLEIERPADPWDRAARSGQVMLSQDKWTELHTTFTVEVPFPEGWSAYVSCTQPNARFRLDMLRLYEGDYVPYGQEAEGQAAAPVRPPVAAAPAPAAPPQPMTPEVGLFDTGSPSPWPLAGDTLLVREGWTQLAEDDVDHEFAGDAVFLNNKLAVALRRDGRGAELYSVGGTTPKIRGVLVPAASDSPARLSSVKVRENTSNAVALDARFQTTGGEEVTLAYELRMGEPFVKTEPGEGVDGLRIQAPCRFAVLPDFVADDVVLDATALHVAQAELPGEHLFLHLLKDREAIVMAVWTSADRDIRLNLSGQGRHRTINSSEIYYGKDGAIWVAVLEAPGVWHAHDVAGRDAGKVVRLDWRAPWPGHWRVDWTRDDNLTGSWEMLSEGSDGRYSKPTWYGYSGRVGANRSRWTTVLGTFNYPCWTDKDGQGYLEPLNKIVRFVGPAIIYPMNRLRSTPLDVHTVIDVLRGTLGVGPCEYVLDLEAQRSSNRGRATCSVRDMLNGIYSRGQQKERREQIEKALTDVVIFITFIRSRIETYIAFGHDIQDYLAEQKKAHPELAAPLSELEKVARTIDARVAVRRIQIRTPAEAAEMADQFRATLLDYEGPDALAKCQQLTEAWVRIGSNQDELAGECRWAVKFLRQRAGLMMAQDPRITEMAKEIRRRAQIAMRGPAGHESSHH